MATRTRPTKTRYLKLVKSDLDFCGVCGATRAQYLRIINRYLDYVENSPTFSRQEIVDFIDSIGNTTSTYKVWILTIIKRFHKIIKEQLPENAKSWPLGPRDGPKIVVRAQPSFDEEMVNKLFSIIHNDRDYAIVRLFYATGMRRDELCRLNDADYNNKTIFISMSKGEEFRTVKLDKETLRVIDKYIESRDDNCSALFVNSYSKRFTPSALTQVFRKYFKTLRAEPRTGFHSLRRGLVTLLYNRGMGELEIQKFMGWKTSTMVERYTQLSPGEISKRVKAIHPFFEES